MTPFLMVRFACGSPSEKPVIGKVAVNAVAITVFFANCRLFMMNLFY
jgi:hypothetical protein